MKKVLLFGGSGRTGVHVLDHARAKGIAVVALVRDPGKLGPREGVEIVAGTPESPETVERAIDGCDAVLSVLNNPRASDMPWASLVNPPHVMETAITNAVAALTSRGRRRIVVLSAF